MKKLYALVVSAMLMLVPAIAHAWSFDLPEENEVLQSEDYNLRLYKNFDFYNGKFNGETMTGNLGDGCFSVSADAASFKLNGFAAYQVLSPEEMTSFYIQIGTGAINLRAAVGKDGLHNYGSGSRFFAVADVKAGQVIVCQWGVSSSRASVVQPADKISGADACTFTDISEEIHAAQIAAQTEEGVEEPAADNFSYWRAESDGYFVIEMQRDCCVQGLQIWIDASASEAVSSPTLKLAGVDGSARLLEFKPGESTFGNECTTWYGIVEAGEQALYLIDSDEVDHIEYVYELDEEGKQVLDGEGNPIVLEEITVYKKVLDPEAAESGNYGDQQFNPEDGSITVSSNDDEDGDGYVTVEAATVSSSGVYSDIVTLKVAVGEITLNAPTFTLVGLNGTMRQYQVGWTNNTLCGEPFTVTVSGDDEEFYEEGVALGTVFEVASNIKATVHVEGYTDGENELTEVLEPGVNFYRKNKEKAEAGEHDWDFVLQDEATKTLIKGAKVDYCYLESDPDTHYTAEEYEAGSSADGNVDLADATPVYVNSGWTWDGGRNRATMNVAQYSETVDDVTTWYALDEGIDKNGNGFGYDPNAWNPFVDGLLVSCPPNANNASTILQYIDKADGDGSDGIGYLGIYFMSRPTLTFERPAAQYGEYVLIYQGAGGSNYTTSRWPSLHQVPADDELHVTLNSGGIHVFYIDVYTNDAVPALEEDEVYVGINGVEASGKAGVVYTLDGRRVNRNGLQKGLYIINGKKVLVK